MSIIVVQEINTRWSKKSRGGADAERRNAVPHRLEISTRSIPTGAIPVHGATVVHHKAYYDEGDAFAEPRIDFAVNPLLPLKIGCVAVDPTDTGAIAAFRYDTAFGGAPERGWARKTMWVELGTWVQIAYNGRFSIGYDGYWEYRKTVVNVGVFEHISSRAFTSTDPSDRFEAMGHLF